MKGVMQAGKDTQQFYSAKGRLMWLWWNSS